MGMKGYRNKFDEVKKASYCLSFLVLVFLLTFAACAHSAPKKVLVLGDSLSAEFGLARGTGWVALMETQLITEKIDAHIINASISGDTTNGGRSRLPALLQRHRPAVVVIELGGNDGLRGLPLSTIEANLRAMIASAKNAKAKVLLVGIQLPPNYGHAYSTKFSALFSKLARDTQSSLVPFLLEGFGDKPHMFQSDGIHPTVDAQPMMRTTVWSHLKPLLK
jgi:acyl-CoA thioesterase I